MASKSSKARKHNSSRKSGAGKSSAGKIALICIIIALIAAFGGLIYWFLPNISDWIGSTWQTLTGILGAGLILIGLAVISIIVIVVAEKSSLFWNRWHICLGVIAILFFSWGLLALIDPALGGTFGNSIISDSLLSGILRLAGILLIGIFLIIPKLTAKGIFYFFKYIGIGIAKFFVFLYSKISGAAKTGKAPRSRKEKQELIKELPVQKPVEPQPESVPIKSTITVGGWQLPHPSILDKPVEIEITQSDVDKRAKLIEDSLVSYGVDAKVVQKNVGPTVTQYGVEPGWDIKYKEVKEKDRDGNIKTRQVEVSKIRVKVDRISSLSNDLALALAAPSIRIESPVPGQSIVGIEVPNTTFGSVNLRSIIESTSYQKTQAKSKLAIPLGKGPGGEVVTADLSKMPHLLVAGSTGSGKTVYLNSIICCLLFNNTPDELNFIMIDPKRVEMAAYNGLPHLSAPVIVEPQKAVAALQWLTVEMDRRYREFADAGARNIEAYNKDRGPGTTMPYIVLVIDELADLMMTAFGEVEHALCRLAQLARATGIHLIVATQRPSVDVITGLIKANFPTRISFSLTSQIDSRTILDSPGAEKLLGRGDMLYMPTDAAKPRRLQGPFLSDSEIDRLVKFWTDQPKKSLQRQIDFEEMARKSAESEEDDLMEEARQLAADHNSISASYLQRKLKIGYPRAARLMEQLKEEQVPDDQEDL